MAETRDPGGRGRTLNVIACPAGASASSFHEIRRPKPATLMTMSVICVYARI